MAFVLPPSMLLLVRSTIPESKSVFEVKEIHDTWGIALRDNLYHMYLEAPRPRNNFSNMDVRRCDEI